MANITVSTAVETNEDPTDPNIDEPSRLEETTHAEFLTIYKVAASNIRFAKDHQWKVVFYYSIGAIVIAVYGALAHAGDERLHLYLLGICWVFSLASIFVLVSLQWWQNAENDKIEYIFTKWSSFSNAAYLKKSKLVSDIQRYGMLVVMILYLELVSIGVTRIFVMKL